MTGHPFRRFRALTAVLWIACLCLSGPLQAQVSAPAVSKLRIVGGLAGLHQYTHNEEPFWTKELPRLSGGKYGAEIVPFDRAGVPGPEMLRLMQLGVVPFGTAIVSNISAQYPEYAAPDLAGLNPSMADLKKAVAAFRPYLEKSLRERHGIEMLAIYTYPAQVVFCKKAFSGLADLAGRRVRVSSATQADFVSALGGLPVLVGFAQILPNMASGNTECVITGSMSGNTLGLHEVTTHVHSMPVSWGLAIFGANQAAWSALPGDFRALLAREIPRLEAAIWLESERETAEGFACNTGQASCSSGRKGQLAQVAVSARDESLRKEILTSTVLPRWIQRCGNRCAEPWNQTIGKALGILTPTPK
jgi:TRAP-type C4-dicarboxylate transport system substrate-binding protein